ncbi:MAG: efflux RND transporter periplasmic adaptor subunit, partial [Eubacteriales bacterium]|nr:efflux RND transporter periplasmic adaptor subunit [Eubacteriales bacterium]
MKKLILLIIVIAVIAAGWFLYFNDGDTAMMVSLSEVTYTDLVNSLEFSGEVTPQAMYRVMSETGGTVAKIYVSEGDEVGYGDALFGLDTTEVESLLKEAELSYDILSDSAGQAVMAQSDALESAAAAQLQEQKAQIALALSQTTGYDYESFNEAFSADVSESAAAMAAALGDMSLDDIYSESEYEAGASDDELEMAELAVKRLKNRLDDMSYESLIEGTVISVNINSGEVLSPAVPAMVIADTENVIVCGYVYEKDVGDLSVGMDVKIHTDEGYYMGTLTKIGEAASEIGDTTSYETMTKVEITPRSIFNKMPGAIVDLEIILSEKSLVLALPLDCITDDGCVYVVTDEDTVEKRAVETGFEDTFNVEIVSGLSAGETVVLSPEDIEEGQRVAYD